MIFDHFLTFYFQSSPLSPRRSAIAQSYKTVQSSFLESKKKRFKSQFADPPLGILSTVAWIVWCLLIVQPSSAESVQQDRWAVLCTKRSFMTWTGLYGDEPKWCQTAGGFKTSNGQGFLLKSKGCPELSGGAIGSLKNLKSSETFWICSNFELSERRFYLHKSFLNGHSRLFYRSEFAQGYEKDS